nr:putative late blight resistance protein homolog R1B-17 [Ipomoea trifida]
MLSLPLRLQTDQLDFKGTPNVKKLGIHLMGYDAYYRKHSLSEETWDLLPPISMEGLLNLHQLENLKFETYECSPKCDIKLLKAFPPNLKKLSLTRTYFSWEDMAIINTLPNLEVLKLRDDAFCGPEWKATGNGFCKLKYLEVARLSSLKHWSVDADHFPILECVFLNHCPHLVEFPTGFGEINTLQLIELSVRYTEKVNSLRDKIRNLQAFLEGSRNNNISKITRRGLESEIRRVARDADLKIESELHQLYLMYNKSGYISEPPKSFYQTLKQVNREIKSIQRRIQIMSKISRVMPPALKQVKRNIQIERKNNHSAAEPQRIENIKPAIGLAKYWIRKLGSKNGMLMSTGLDRKACHWISNQSIHLDSPISTSCTSHQEFRSILYFPKASGLLANYSSQTFPSYPKLLRVLDLSLYDLVDIPSEIVNLVCLRYLALRTNAPLKDYKWSELLCLQTFIVETIGPNAPGEVWKSPIDILNNMPRLRHVLFSKSSLYLPRQETNLQTISGLYYRPEPRRSSQNFRNIPFVKKLGIYIDITPVSDPKLLPEDASQQHSSLNDLVHLQRLENLKIDVPQVIHFQDVFRLPTSFPSNLKKLTLEGTCLPWDDMAIIATLPNLEALKLKHNAFCGSEWKTMENGFCKLKYLKIAVLDFEHWSASFPVLECLILDFCRKLKKFPIGFADITTLQLIELTRCDSSLVTSAKQIHEEQLEYLGYTKLVIRDYCTLP